MKKTVPIIICLLITYLATAIAQNVAYNFTNKVTFTKSGNGHISKFIGMLPLPISNLYQDIANLTYSGGEEIVEGRYGNHVLMADRSDFPGSQYVMSSSFAIHPISVTNRSGRLGSYYSVSDYRDVNPEFGTKEDILQKIHYLSDLLISLRSKGYHGSCWGYNFDWQSRRLFLFPAYCPTVVATCFCASALFEAYG